MPNENQPVQGNAGARGEQASILGSSLPSTGVTYELNGVTLVVANNPQAFPTNMDLGDPAFLWPTSAMAMRTSVLMTSGETWLLNRPPSGLFGGGIQVSMKPRAGSRIAVFNVPEESLDVPIWPVGYAQPVPEPEPEPTPVDPSNFPPDQIAAPGPEPTAEG